MEKTSLKQWKNKQKVTDMDIDALRYLSYGMYVVSSVKEGDVNGQIANCAIQIDNNPVTIAVSINKKNLTHEYIESSSLFSISVLEKAASLRLIGKFGFQSGRAVDKFKDIRSETLASGCPAVLDNALCYLGTKVINKMDCGAYTLFLGEVTEAKALKQGEPMTYDYYHKEKCGTTPETAPTFIKGKKPETVCADLPKYRCTVCNYVYNPAVGDPDGGIPPGTPFESLPNNWTCPICGVDKSKFVKME